MILFVHHFWFIETTIFAFFHQIFSPKMEELWRPMPSSGILAGGNLWHKNRVNSWQWCCDPTRRAATSPSSVDFSSFFLGKDMGKVWMFAQLLEIFFCCQYVFVNFHHFWFTIFAFPTFGLSFLASFFPFFSIVFFSKELKGRTFASPGSDHVHSSRVLARQERALDAAETRP